MFFFGGSLSQPLNFVSSLREGGGLYSYALRENREWEGKGGGHVPSFWPPPPPPFSLSPPPPAREAKQI